MCRKLFGLVLVGLLVGGCAQTHTSSEAPPDPYYVPSVALVSQPRHAIDAYQVLSGPIDPENYAYRAEKFVYGETSVATFSAFTSYTYDNQTISTPGSWGTRYRTVVQGAWAIPPSP